MDIINIINDLVKKEEIEWDLIINELINKKIIDPENIDLDILIDYYIKIIRELKNKESFDFILSSKVLVLLVYFLKLKVQNLINSLYFNNLEESEEVFFEEEEIYENRTPSKKKEIKKELKLKILYERKRKVTLEDLREAINEILEKEEKRKKTRKLRKEQLEDLATMEYNIEKETELILDALSRFEKNEISFFELLKIILKEKTNIKEEIVKKFIPLLYLDFQKEIEIEQNKVFEDFLIKKINTNKS